MSINKNFTVRHGLEVDTDLILADADKNKVGIGTTNPRYTLHVNGGIGATDLYVSGISTLSSLVLTGTVSIGTSTGSVGQYIKATGIGVTWEDFPVGRTSTTFTASQGQTTFNYAYAVGLVDVFVNGIKLTPAEFTATDAVTVVLAEACFGGETVDIHAYSVRGIGAGQTGISGLTFQDEGSLIGNPQGVTSINIVGASLTSTGSGAGVTIFLPDQWTTTTVGLHTLSNVGVGTTNPTSKLTVGGDVKVTGISTLGIVQVSSGIVTATSGIVTYYGDTSNTINGRWTLGANGTSDYTFTGIGFTQTTNDPVLYLARGRVYEFVNNSGGSHPFEIRVSNGGAAYSDGVTNNAAATGVIRFEIPFNAPNTLYYQCTNHSGMGNTISVYPSTI